MNGHLLRRGARRLRRWLRTSEAALILMAIAVGVGAGLLTRVQGLVAHGLQRLLYGVGINRLSALESIQHPWKLLALPLGGLVLIAANRLFARRPPPLDVVEANALHGGRLPWMDSVVICVQTLISNGFGASVGLEAAYTQAGGAFASRVGQMLGLKREDLRVLLGAGAGAAIGAAFGAPLAGAFYGFEIVIGAYTPAAIAPVAAAALSARLVVRLLGGEAYLVAPGEPGHIGTLAYGLAAGLGLVSALAGIAVMRGQTTLERLVSRSPLPGAWRPLVGGLLLMPIAYACPQALSAGHGALRLEMALQPAVGFLLTVFALKALASIVSLSFGFRGGLFFASLFLGSLLGPVYASAVNALAGGPLLDPHEAALVGMAAFSVTVVGGPMTLALLVLETTHDFALTGVVLMAVLTASAFARAHFGYSFSTWRLHLRGSSIRSARDLGWRQELTARRLMRRAPHALDMGLSVSAFRAGVPLGSTSRVLLTDPQGRYAGMVLTAEAYDPALDVTTPLAALARLADTTLAPSDGLATILERFEHHHTENLAVVDEDGQILGLVTETYARRRLTQELEKQQARLFGESD